VTCATNTNNQDGGNGYGTGAQDGLTINVVSPVSVIGTDNGIAVNNGNTINNAGAIVGQTAAFPEGNGIKAGDPGAAGPVTITVNNASTGIISGDLNGISASNVANDAIANVVNFGTIQGAGFGDGIAAPIVNVTNSGLITGAANGVTGYGAAPSSVINNNTINGAPTTAFRSASAR
jgi:hypothetical protein